MLRKLSGPRVKEERIPSRSRTKMIITLHSVGRRVRHMWTQEVGGATVVTTIQVTGYQF